MHDEDKLNRAIQTTITGGAYAPLAVPENLHELEDYQERHDSALAALEKYSLVTPEDPNWVLHGDQQPIALWVRGKIENLTAMAANSIAITGARAATAYGTTTAQDLASAALAAGVTPVTGGAFGVDTAVITACLAERKPTLVIATCGLDKAYPNANRELFDRVVEGGGAIISAYGPGVVPTRSRFLERGRTLAEISTRGTVLVEAGPRSGALAVAGRASVMSRRVYAVPGPVTSVTSLGPNGLISEGAAQAIPSADWLTKELM